ncbi:hypothetical protein Mgra_00002009 [Meloidogyne graminicola]|uniref:Transmembrane protein n=1 Tax=Meloidogyne graminicola TaxID=189291 RepID=A0A8S9ZY73_9BILA|nr:hypothetical protein Mgra_00002009 [Meloidogyne graminicola]
MKFKIFFEFYFKINYYIFLLLINAQQINTKTFNNQNNLKYQQKMCFQVIFFFYLKINFYLFKKIKSVICLFNVNQDFVLVIIVLKVLLQINMLVKDVKIKQKIMKYILMKI